MKVCIYQINNCLDITKNIEKIKSRVRSLSEDCYALILPECTITGYTSNKDKIIKLDLMDHRLMELQALCVELGKHVFVGAVLEDYNAYLHIHDRIEVYNKIHLGSREEKIFKAGESLITFETPFKAGTAICLESHIPELFLAYRKLECEVMLLPFASPNRSGSRKGIWSKYIPARSYDFGMFSIAVNLVGKLDDLSFSGGMMLVNPRGEILYEYYGQDEHSVEVDLDLDLVKQVQTKGNKKNYFDRRKPDIYKGVLYGIQ